MGRIRILRQPLPVLLGAAPAPGRHPRRAPRRLRADRRQSRRTADPARHLHRRPSPGRHPAWPDPPADRQYYGATFEAALAAGQLTLLRPARKGEPERPGAPLFKPLRQTIESINQTFKAQLDLERHGGHTATGVMVRVLPRILALTAAIWTTTTPAHPSTAH
jgi:hypothetical protein